MPTQQPGGICEVQLVLRVVRCLQALLLMAHIAQFALRLIGPCATAQQLQLQSASTNRTDRAEISVMTLSETSDRSSRSVGCFDEPRACIKQLRRQATKTIELQPGVAWFEMKHQLPTPLAKSFTTCINASPYRASLACPTPLTSPNSSTLLGRRFKISSSVLS